ncbi:LicD family protein [Cuneatibacter caecimuris]|uniref:Lipopolysaccharide cholinephosphotransferase n=1 Tax=Cuneatibacter caecimuris TaxID=1796618 RepID=A0A4Q7NZ95_9FIRM|nr:LicD family protein [Cuneatibacter caecimuris]RZS92685.1 lipopolysaccharide cholinephosphotransferase [Cuneatibacter caecimuris]
MLETNKLFKELAKDNQNLQQLSSQEIRTIQDILLDMLRDFDYVCKKYDLSYFLCGGTAIGAVRHQGYIPWDEDVDIGMPRSDYDRFERLMLREFEEKYWIQSIQSSLKYDLNFMKVRRKGTKYVEVFEQEEEFAGIFIDVYPIENVYNFLPLRWIHGFWVELMLFCASCVRIYLKLDRLTEYVGKNRMAYLICFKAFLGKRLSFFSITKWCLLVDRWASKCKNEDSKYVNIPSGRKHFFGEMYTRKSFFPLKETEFEGEKFYIMSDPNEYLTKLYGNYMEVPKEEERERHSIVKLDLEKYNE